MKTGRTLQELAVEIDRQSHAKRDFVASAQSMNMAIAVHGDPVDNRFELRRRGAADAESFGMTGLFHRQLGESVGIPAKYYDRMRGDNPALLAYNVNHWLRKDESRRTVRTLDGEARAYLSDRYRMIDNDQIIQGALPILAEIPGARVESCEVTPSRLYLKILNPRLEAEVRKGDVVQAGICISNSEVGLGSVSVMPLAMRLVCLNGMICPDAGIRKYHVGRERDECWDTYSDETRRADDGAFMLKLADVARAPVDATKFHAIVDRLREAAGARINAPVADVVEITSQRFGFTKPETDGILQYLIEGGDLTLYGLTNAVTRAAQDADNYDRATDMERAGWRIATDADTLRLIGGNAG